jgi:ParB-like chromosome segregation protein Spo0J
MTARARPDPPPSTPPVPDAEQRPGDGGNGEPMAVEVIAVADLHIDPGNVRRHPARSITDIKASLARFGQQKPVVIDANNVVRAGNGTLEAARELGWPTLRCVRTGLSGTDATAYSIADNKVALSAEWDDDALAKTLRAL